MEERLIKDNGHFILDGEVVEIPEFPLEFHPSSEAMEDKLSGTYLHNLMHEYTTESYWKDIVPLCPICGKVAVWTNVADTTVDMVILHSMLLEWVLDHNVENQIRNADNKLVKLECGCELTIQDFIKPCPVPSSTLDITNRIDHTEKTFKECIEELTADDYVKNLTPEEKKVFDNLVKRLDGAMGEKLREEYCKAIAPTIKIRNFTNNGNGNFKFDLIMQK